MPHKKQYHEKIDGFDPYFFLDWENHDLGCKINLSAFNITTDDIKGNGMRFMLTYNH